MLAGPPAASSSIQGSGHALAAPWTCSGLHEPGSNAGRWACFSTTCSASTDLPHAPLRILTEEDLKPAVADVGFPDARTQQSAAEVLVLPSPVSYITQVLLSLTGKVELIKTLLLKCNLIEKGTFPKIPC